MVFVIAIALLASGCGVSDGSPRSGVLGASSAPSARPDPTVRPRPTPLPSVDANALAVKITSRTQPPGLHPDGVRHDQDRAEGWLRHHRGLPDRPVHRARPRAQDGRFGRHGHGSGGWRAQQRRERGRSPSSARSERGAATCRRRSPSADQDGAGPRCPPGPGQPPDLTRSDPDAAIPASQSSAGRDRGRPPRAR